MEEKNRILKNALAVFAIPAVICGLYAGQWPFALLVALIAGVLGFTLQMGERDDTDNSGEERPVWWKRWFGACKDNRSVFYLALMATMILHTLDYIAVTIWLGARVLLIVGIEVFLDWRQNESEWRSKHHNKQKNGKRSEKKGNKRYL